MVLGRGTWYVVRSHITDLKTTQAFFAPMDEARIETVVLVKQTFRVRDDPKQGTNEGRGVVLYRPVGSPSGVKLQRRKQRVCAEKEEPWGKVLRLEGGDNCTSDRFVNVCIKKFNRFFTRNFR